MATKKDHKKTAKVKKPKLKRFDLATFWGMVAKVIELEQDMDALKKHVGIAGPKGETGKQGEQGETGPRGKKGGFTLFEG